MREINGNESIEEFVCNNIVCVDYCLFYNIKYQESGRLKKAGAYAKKGLRQLENIEKGASRRLLIFYASCLK